MPQSLSPLSIFTFVCFLYQGLPFFGLPFIFYKTMCNYMDLILKRVLHECNVYIGKLYPKKNLPKKLQRLQNYWFVRLMQFYFPPYALRLP